MPSPCVLVVGCGFPQLGLIRAARAAGLRVAGADASAEAIGAGECDAFVRASTHDPDAVARAVLDAAAEGVTTCGSELALRTTADVAARLGMPFYADPETVLRCQRKDLMRSAYAQGGAPAPAFVRAASLDEARAFVRERGLPVVVKPARGWGQRGVAKVERAEELGPALARAVEAAGAGAALDGGPAAVVEEFVEGVEVSVNAWTDGDTTDVFSVTERVITSYPDPPGITFAEAFPSGLPADLEARAVEAARAGVRALGIARGPTYTQVRVGAGGAFLVETAHRLGGGLDPDIALLASGVSLYRRILGVALGRADWERAGPEAPAHGGAVGKFLIGRPGRVRAVEGLGAARAMPGVVGAETYVRPGGIVHPLTDGSKRAGHVLVVGRDRAEADERAARAAAAVRIVTEAAP